MAIKVGQGFQRTSIAPIDESLVLSKAQMLTIDDTLMPSKYFAICTDDGKLYLYDKEATPSAETGKYTVLEGGGGGSTPSKTYTMDWVEATKSLTLSDGTDVQTLPLTGLDFVYIATIGTTTAVQLKEAIAAGKIILCCMDPDDISTSFIAGYNAANTLEDIVTLSLMCTIGSDVDNYGRVIEYKVIDENGSTTWEPTYVKDLQPKLTAGENITIENDVISAIGGSAGVELTQAEYDALTDEEKNNGTIYFVTDGQGGGGSGSGVPAGGTTGQALVKKSNADGDVEWKTIEGSGTIPSGWGVAKMGSVTLTSTSGSHIPFEIIDITDLGLSSVDDYEVLVTLEGNRSTNYKVEEAFADKISATQFEVAFYTPSQEGLTVNVSYAVIAKDYGVTGLPSGGSTNQVLVKLSDADGDCQWANAGSGTIIVDSALSTTSENPVQNKVITAAIGDIETILNTLNSGGGA